MKQHFIEGSLLLLPLLLVIILPCSKVYEFSVRKELTVTNEGFLIFNIAINKVLQIGLLTGQQCNCNSVLVFVRLFYTHAGYHDHHWLLLCFSSASSWERGTAPVVEYTSERVNTWVYLYALMCPWTDQLFRDGDSQPGLGLYWPCHEQL